jgi:hypothetical protein
LNHNQSRRACHGAGDFVSAAIGGVQPQSLTASESAGESPVPPSAQACNATVKTWDSSSRYFFYGCPGSTADCFVSYGHDGSLVAPDDFAETEYATLGCDDAKRGDGVCDLCLIAKYGYDVREGSAGGADDCVPASTNECRDVAWDAQAGADVLTTYVATHEGATHGGGS